MAQVMHIDAVRAPTGAHAPASPTTGEGAKFQQMLERLQRLAEQRPIPADVDSPEQLQNALRTADDGFVAAMDLRRQLEEAFRRHMS